MNTIQHIMSSALGTKLSYRSGSAGDSTVITIQYTPGTKLSYRSGRADRVGDSTVIVLKSGELLELRRGKDTKSKARFPSVEAWRATLPAGATIAEDKPANQHPDIQRITAFLAKKDCSRSWDVSVRNSIWRPATNAEKIAYNVKQIADMEARIAHLETQYHRGIVTTRLRENIMNRQALITQLRVMPEPAPQYYLHWKKNCSNALLYGAGADELEAIGISVKCGLFGASQPDGSVRLVKRLADLGYARYYIRVGEKIVYFPLE